MQVINGNLIAVIVSFNRLEKLKLRLEQIFKNDFYKIVVVGNCSIDDTGDWLDRLNRNFTRTLSNPGPWVKPLCSKERIMSYFSSLVRRILGRLVKSAGVVTVSPIAMCRRPGGYRITRFSGKTMMY